MKFCDENKNVVEWASEEIVIPYFCSRRKNLHRYFVDFWLKLKNKEGAIKKYLIEIKPSSQTICPKPTKGKSKKTFMNEVMTYQNNMDKWKAAEKYCSNMGLEFLVLTEAHLF